LIRKARVGRVLILEIYGNNTKPCVPALREDRGRELLESPDVGSAICFKEELAPEQRSKRGVEYIASKVEVYAKPIKPLPVDISGKSTHVVVYENKVEVATS